MKRILFLFAINFMALIAFAQSPDLMSYQAVIRNAAGKVLIDLPVGVRIKILQKTDVGNSVYEETYETSTNKNGLVTLKIGAGTIVSGSITAIDWSDGPYFLQIETDPNGGTAYSISNVSQMLSTPYTLFSKTSGDAWKIGGNIATSESYIGTINNTPLVFKVGTERTGYMDSHANIFWGQQAGTNNTGYGNSSLGAYSLLDNSTGTGNVALGYSALTNNTTGKENVANGSQALAINTTGTNNIAVGAFALFENTIGNYNTALGNNALKFNTIGNYNTASGNLSLYSNVGGSFNVANGDGSLYKNVSGEANLASGVSALYSNISGNSNTAIGTNSLYFNTTGESNSAVGREALERNTIGNFNVANGFEALYHNTTGNYNVAIGANSLYTNTTGASNTTVGNNSDVSSVNLTNATAVGAGSIVNASNKVRIGNTSVTKIEGQVAFSFPSDARFKFNIKHNVPGLDFIKKLQPITYYFDNEKLDEFTKTGVINNSNIYPVSYKGEREIHTGFLAQDVEKSANELGYHFDGVRTPSNDKDHYSLAYSQFIMPLVKGMQEQQTIIEKLQTKVEKLQKQIDKLTQK